MKLIDFILPQNKFLIVLWIFIWLIPLGSGLALARACFGCPPVPLYKGILGIAIAVAALVFGIIHLILIASKKKKK